MIVPWAGFRGFTINMLSVELLGSVNFLCHYDIVAGKGYLSKPARHFDNEVPFFFFFSMKVYAQKMHRTMQ